MSKLHISYESTSALTPLEHLARTHPKHQVRAIAKSIEAFGWTIPILTDGNNRVIAGWARVLAAKLIKIELVPVIKVEDMSDAQIRAYAIADNKLATTAGWDTHVLASEFKLLDELNFDVGVTGFHVGEIDLILRIAEGPPKADGLPSPKRYASAVSRVGDLWVLGKHRLYCGDATNTKSYDSLLDGASAQMVITDPPYNVPIDGHVSGSGRHREFAMASGEMSPKEFTNFLRVVLTHLIEYSTDGSVHFLFMDWRHSFELLEAAKSLYSQYLNLCVWDKNNGGMGSLYRSKHELVHVFKHGSQPHINNVELGKFGRNRTNVWSYGGVNTFKPGRSAELAMHPTVKPVDMIADAILDCSKPHGVILDPFAGSGTVIIAAQQSRRRAYAMEIDPHYVDTAVERWQEFTGLAATLAMTGEPFDQIRKDRCSEASPNHFP